MARKAKRNSEIKPPQTADKARRWKKWMMSQQEMTPALHRAATTYNWRELDFFKIFSAMLD